MVATWPLLVRDQETLRLKQELYIPIPSDNEEQADEDKFDPDMYYETGKWPNAPDMW